MAHITGGGITDNLPRMLPAGTDARRATRDRGTCRRIFSGSQRAGAVPREDMLRTFNMGIGLIVVSRAGDAERGDRRARRRRRARARVIGEIAHPRPEPRVR